MASAHPGIEVEAIEYLLQCDLRAFAIELVYVVTIFCSYQHVCQSRTQIAQGHVQLSPQVRDGIECLKAFYGSDSCYWIHEGLCVMVDVATLLEIAPFTDLPKLFTGHAAQ